MESRGVAQGGACDRGGTYCEREGNGGMLMLF